MQPPSLSLITRGVSDQCVHVNTKGLCEVGSYLLGGLDESRRHWQKVLRIPSTTWGSHHIGDTVREGKCSPAVTRQHNQADSIGSAGHGAREPASSINRELKEVQGEPCVHTLTCSSHARGTSSTRSSMTRGSSAWLARSGKMTPRV